MILPGHRHSSSRGVLRQDSSMIFYFSFMGLSCYSCVTCIRCTLSWLCHGTTAVYPRHRQSTRLSQGRGCHFHGTIMVLEHDSDVHPDNAHNPDMHNYSPTQSRCLRYYHMLQVHPCGLGVWMSCTIGGGVKIVAMEIGGG